MTTIAVVPVLVILTEQLKFIVYVDYHQDMVYFLTHKEYETDDLKRKILASLDHNFDLKMPEIPKSILDEINQLRTSNLTDFQEI